MTGSSSAAGNGSSTGSPSTASSVRVRTPLRLPFAGGLTDIKQYAELHGGTTVSSTIDLGVEVSVAPHEEAGFTVHAGGATETAVRAEQLRNDLVRSALARVGYRGPGLDIDIAVEVQDHSGLGTSGAITVALVHALRLIGGEAPTPAGLAEDATHIEVEMLSGASGYHDANVCARGGLLRIDYDGPTATAARLETPAGFMAAFQDSLLLFATGRRASTKASLGLLSAGFESALDVLHQMKELADDTATALQAGELARVAHCIGEQQRLKQLLPGSFVDAFVEEVGDKVRATGASAQFPGGKIGGYVLVCCPDGQQQEVRSALSAFDEVPVHLTSAGSRQL